MNMVKNEKAPQAKIFAIGLILTPNITPPPHIVNDRSIKAKKRPPKTPPVKKPWWPGSGGTGNELILESSRHLGGLTEKSPSPFLPV